MVLAVGWSGQWAAAVRARRRGALRLTAGMETHAPAPAPRREDPHARASCSSPGRATTRTTGNNLLRRLLLAHYLPRIDGELVMPPVAQCLQGYYYLTGQAGEQFEMKALPKAAAARRRGLLDRRLLVRRQGASGGRRSAPGRSTASASRTACDPSATPPTRAGMKFVLWFEPERVRHGSRPAPRAPRVPPAAPARPGQPAAEPRQPAGPRATSPTCSRTSSPRSAWTSTARTSTSTRCPTGRPPTRPTASA